MIRFWVAAAFLAAVALGFLLVPLARERRRRGSWSLSGLGVSLATVPCAVGLYLFVTTFNSEAPTGASEAEMAMVSQLAAKMVENPDDVAGWRLLGRSYLVLGQYGLARRAYLEAWQRTPAPDSELKLGLSEALIYTDRASLLADAGDLVEEVLRDEPSNQRALWWGGVVAIERGQDDLARTRWSRLLALDPGPEVSELLRQQLGRLGGAVSGSAGVGAAGGGEVAAAGEVSSGPTFTINVRLAEGLPTERLGPSSALFILARRPGVRQPIAVIRESAAAVPGTFVLSDANAISMPGGGGSLADVEELSIVARLSIAGVASEASGDLFAETTFKTGGSETIELVIDQVVP